MEQNLCFPLLLIVFIVLIVHLVILCELKSAKPLQMGTFGAILFQSNEINGRKIDLYRSMWIFHKNISTNKNKNANHD